MPWGSAYSAFAARTGPGRGHPSRSLLALLNHTMTHPAPPPAGERLYSGDFTTAGFRPHGEFWCWMEGSLLMWEARGPFNLEALQAYGLTRRAAFERWQLDDRPLAAVMHWQVSALMSPAAFDFYERSFTAFIQSRHQYVAVAWVGDSGVEGLDLMRLRYEPLFRRHGLAFELFPDVQSARDWAMARLRAAQARPGGSSPHR